MENKEEEIYLISANTIHRVAFFFSELLEKRLEGKTKFEQEYIGTHYMSALTPVLNSEKSPVLISLTDKIITRIKEAAKKHRPTLQTDIIKAIADHVMECEEISNEECKKFAQELFDKVELMYKNKTQN